MKAPIPKLTMEADKLAELMRELRHRGRGSRESGAFLLAAAPGPGGSVVGGRPRPVARIVYYDDLDPASLNGAIDFTAAGYTALAELCRKERLQVVGDVHTHPSRTVRQSATDATHPMSVLPGHVALIVPDFAQGHVGTASFGAHLHLGGGRWRSSYGREVADVLSITRSGGLGARLAGRLRSVVKLRRRSRD